ncbi:MAG: ABC transporter permease [Pseudonocardia sp.]
MISAGLLLVLTVAVLAACAPLFTDPLEVDVFNRLAAPNLAEPMGTDALGRDYLSRIAHGAQVSFTLAAVVVTFKILVGVLLGAAAGYAGRFVDGAISRMIDLFLALPSLILALAIAAILGPSTVNVILALVVVGWEGYARLVRGAILTVKVAPWVESSRAIGCRRRTIVVRHVLPHVVAPLLVFAALDIGHTILAVAALSFLGLGVPPPTPEWGGMLAESTRFLETSPHLMIFPGLLILLSVLAFTLLGDGLRDRFDPRAKDTVVL